MTAQQKFTALLMKFYQKSNQTFDELDEEIYFGGIDPIGIDRALDALMTLARTKGLNRLPSVGDILETAGIRQPDEEDIGNFLAGRIIQCIAECGGYAAEKARTKLGELGWEVVRRAGGWDTLCMIEDDQLGTFRAQLRDLAISVNSHASIGALEKPFDLPEAPKGISDARSSALQLVEHLSKKQK